MGQYWLIVNLSKGQYVEPKHVKLLEIAWNPDTVWIVTGLLADPGSNGLGNGDFEYHPCLGLWAGDRVVLVGDYGPDGLYVDVVAQSLGLELTEDDRSLNLWRYIQQHGTNVTEKVYKMIETIKRD